MDTPDDQFSAFLAAVATLRDDNEVRTTAHTSSVSADDWPTPHDDADPATDP